ncbi:MAG TPA: CaiB/BaiF CoA-transferase family protein [Steroidobacteraceae bacterium]|nr:CaiB/BaiF CoA-transferase family protein [Steroidobacteraceae bacterium]
MSQALSHLTVLDLSRVLAGPWAGQILGDLGAQVYKIERPGAGDDTRSWGPPFLQNAAEGGNADAAYFLCANRNKKSLTVDFTTALGRRIVQDLAARADVLIENFKTGGLQAHGLDFESLREINPRLIYCSITGFGQTGPYAARPGYDFLIQAMGGLMSITGAKDGEPGAGPQKVGVAMTDILTGLYAVIGILAALAHRERSGAGQYIDVALLDVQVACLANQAMNYLVGGTPPVRMGNAHPNIVPYQDFPTADGHMVVAVGNDAQFARLCAELGHAELAGDARFTSNEARVANRQDLIGLLRAATAARSTAEWVERLQRAQVPCGPINALDEVFADPQVQARGMRLDLPHPVAGSVPQVASPLRLSATPVRYRSAPPALGADTRELLRDVLHMSAEEIDSLAAKKII